MAMNPDSGNDPRLAAIYRAGAEPAQPPAHLDDTIRAAARRAVHAGPRSSPNRLRRWSMPVSLAAVVVLSVTIVTMMREEGVDPLQENSAVVVPPPAAPAASPAQPAAAPVELAKEAPAAAPAPAPAPAQAARAPAPEPKKIESAAIASAERVRPELSPVPQTAVAGARPPAADSVADAAVGAREDRAAAAASAPQAQRRAAPAALMAEKSRDQAVLGRQAAVQESAARPAEPDPLWRDLDREPAEKWLERLRSLRREGREQDFGRLLAEFRRRFPGRELPEDLR